MGWLGELLKTLRESSPTEMVLILPLPTPAGSPEKGEAFVADQCYVELYVESFRIAKARRFASTFNGLVYSFVSMAREGEPSSQLAAISKPKELAELDGQSLDKVITVSKRMMGAMPWRGGRLGLQLGLFSIKSGNLLTPLLDFVTKVSLVAGVSFVGAVKPFLPLINEGMELLSGQREDTALEVGLDSDLDLTASGLGAIIAAPKGSISPADVSVDPLDHKLLLRGKPLEYGYCVFSLRRLEQKVDYGEIPDLKDRYAALQSAIRDNKRQEAIDAMTAFRLAAIASPDLITSDATRLVERAQQKIIAAFPAGGVARVAAPIAVEVLADLDLYSAPESEIR